MKHNNQTVGYNKKGHFVFELTSIELRNTVKLFCYYYYACTVSTIDFIEPGEN